ncbi:hypothetical protein [Haladaptatus sp. GCM10025893]|uniref:hypothetical protein n=1 Tax=Haladaptatus sp. GCM10025893 TaxID=3252659 RepID=UPI00362414BE
MTVIVFDHREPMRQGRPGRTKLDYARQGALTLVSNARAVGEPLGFFAVGDDGVSKRFQPTTGRSAYDTIAAYLYERLDTPDQPGGTRAARRVRPTIGDRRRTHDNLQSDTTRFGEALRPFFAAQVGTGVEHEDPLFRTVRANVRNYVNCDTVIFTDDSSRSDVLDAVKLARTGQSRVFVFLTPSVLFDPAHSPTSSKPTTATASSKRFAGDSNASTASPQSKSLPRRASIRSCAG